MAEMSLGQLQDGSSSSPFPCGQTAEVAMRALTFYAYVSELDKLTAQPKRAEVRQAARERFASVFALS